MLPYIFSVLSPNNTTKPTQMGFKLWSLADMDGYLYHCEVYQGKNQTFVDKSVPKYFGVVPTCKTST